MTTRASTTPASTSTTNQTLVPANAQESKALATKTPTSTSAIRAARRKPAWRAGSSIGGEASCRAGSSAVLLGGLVRKSPSAASGIFFPHVSHHPSTISDGERGASQDGQC